MNIKSNFSKHPCTSCQVCAAICPHQAIEIKLDKYGILSTIHKNRCNAQTVHYVLKFAINLMM